MVPGIMFIADSWASFMMTPGGVSDFGALVDPWAAIDNFTWMPINIHRLLANVAFGGSIAAAYAGFRFLNARTVEERAVDRTAELLERSGATRGAMRDRKEQQ